MKYLIIACLFMSSCDSSDKYQVGDTVCVYGIKGTISWPKRLFNYTVTTVDSLGQIHKGQFREHEIKPNCK